MAMSSPFSMTQGFTSFPHKVDALLYALALETTITDRQLNLRDYGLRVIGCLSDQGASWYMGLGGTQKLMDDPNRVPRTPRSLGV